MAQIIADVMTRDPATVERRESTWAAARRWPRPRRAT